MKLNINSFNFKCTCISRKLKFCTLLHVCILIMKYGVHWSYTEKKIDKDTDMKIVFMYGNCSNVKGLTLGYIPQFYLNALQSFSR